MNLLAIMNRINFNFLELRFVTSNYLLIEVGKFIRSDNKK